MHELTENKTSAVGESPNAGMPDNWQNLAERRLQRLVDTEHAASVACERLDAVQADYRSALRTNEDHLRTIRDLRLELERQRENENILKRSLSWRLTTPLRWMSRGAVRMHSTIRLRIARQRGTPMFRWLVRLIVRISPGLAARLQSALH